MHEQRSTVRCRFAPSPTGYLHVGGARTALFNYLFARRHNGTFILRIEDTDIARSTDEATTAILQSMEWLGLQPDEGPFYQSRRFDLYRQYAEKLLASGHAYRCTCTTEELEAMREAQRQRGEKTRYDRRHRPAAAEPQPTTLPTGQDETPFVIRLRTPIEGATVFNDLVLGQVSTPNEELDDFIIIRSDGTPTYNFVVVADDVDMQITHVIRGSDHVPNTPKQVVIYQALGAPLPVFAHVPMILGPDKKKLSKRHGAVSVYEYRSEGFLSDAFVNYLARLSWSHGDQEIFERAELEQLFSLEQVGKSPAVFDMEKLFWVSGEHIKRAPLKTLLEGVIEFLPEEIQTSRNGALLDDPAFALLVEQLRERSRTLKEAAASCGWYFVDDPLAAAEPSLVKKQLTAEAAPRLRALAESLCAAPEFTAPQLEKSFTALLAELGVGFGKLAQPARLALTGQGGGIGLYTIMEILGRERTVARLERAADQADGRAG